MLHENQAVHSEQNRNADELQLVSFQVDAEEFGIDILKVREIIRPQDLTRVPHMPDFVDGVINLRGQVIPVVGLRRRLGLKHKEWDRNSRIVVTEIGSQVIGLTVDAVRQVLRIPQETIEAPPRLAHSEREFVSGIGRLDSRLLLMLNTEQLLNEQEAAEMQAAA